MMQNRLLAVSPGNILPDSDYLLTDKARTLPLRFALGRAGTRSA
jgi:hypothetical protein